MDFLDPKKQKAYKIRLLIGYCLIGIALLLTTVILLYQAYGFGVNKNGQIVQSGLVFVDSVPSPAQVYLDGSRYKNDTNTRISLPSGQYTIRLTRSGYTPWQHAVSVQGGSVEYLDYPFLFPSKLQTTALKGYPALPRLVTQSLDRHWMLTQQADDNASHFELLDLTQPKQPAKEITIPAGILATSQPNTPDSWEIVQWASDNKHVLLRHNFTKQDKLTYEYVLINRADPAQAVNLTNTWGINPSAVSLHDQKYDNYLLYDKSAATLATASLSSSSPATYLDHVLAYQSYGPDAVLYVTDKNAPAGRVNVVWHQGKDNYVIRSVSSSDQYFVSLAQYSGDWFVAIVDPLDHKVYIYKNPLDMLKAGQVDVPIHVLKANDVNYLQFSNNFRFVLAESGTQFAVYDAENDKGFIYDNKHSLDQPQEHAVWMDGHRLSYVSNGKTVVFDFDGANLVNLSEASTGLPAFFSPDYKYMYTFSNPGNTITATIPGSQTVLDQTALRTTQDL